MLSLDLAVPALARRRRAGGFPPPTPVIFPAGALAYWEGQGQSNMTGFNNVADVPAFLRIVNADIEVMTNEPGWAPYALLDTGESETVESVTYTGPLDEVEIPPAMGGVSPLIGLHEAMLAGEMSAGGELGPEALLLGKFADAGKHLNEFLPDYDSGLAPLGGANFLQRNLYLPASLRARIASAPLFAQGKVWMHGEANALVGRNASDVNVPDIANYASDFGRIRAFDRAQLGAPSLPYYLCAISEFDQFDAEINAQLESACRWLVAADGSVTDLGAGRDDTSYFIDHGIVLGGSFHFSAAQMITIGALVWSAHKHHAGQYGLTEAHQITSITPVHQREAALTEVSDTEVTVNAVVNEDGVFYALAQSVFANAPSVADIIVGAQATAAAVGGHPEDITISGLTPETDYEIWIAFEAASGDRAVASSVLATTEETPAQSGWTPADAGALIWHDAQDAATVTEAAGEVTAWASKAGGPTLAPFAATAHPVLNAAGINGLPAIDFDGDDDLLASGVSLSPDMCLLVVAEVDLVTNGSESLIDFLTTNLKIRAGTSNTFYMRFELQNGANTFLFPSPLTDYTASPHMFLVRFDSAADRIELFVDGQARGGANSYTIDLAATDDMYLMRPFGGSIMLDGKIGEVVAIPTAAHADREMLEGYAAHHWGLADLLPASHPYKSAAP